MANPQPACTIRAPGEQANGGHRVANAGGVDPAGPWQQAWKVRCKHFAPRIRFDRPLATIAVSVTGTACALGCAHCNGHYLRGMHSLQDEAVWRAHSLLISGGCDGLGRVPVLPHLQEIAAAGRGKRLNWHVGLIDEETMLAIRPYVDVVSFDFVGDDETIREVYGLQRSVEDYADTYRMLRRHVRVVPHLTLGLRGGRMSGERRALALLGELGLEALVFIVFTPPPARPTPTGSLRPSTPWPTSWPRRGCCCRRRRLSWVACGRPAAIGKCWMSWRCAWG